MTKKEIAKEAAGWLFYMLLVVVLVYFIINYVGNRTQVEGSSMEPALSNGDNLIVEKLSYRFSEPSRYDIVIFPYQHAEDTYYIKRLIGLPGETVQIVEGYVYIDGEKLEEHYGAEVMDTPGLAEQPIKLGEDEYFVLGDNRNHSSDSRDPSVGVLKREQLIGRAWIRVFPFNKIGVIKHE